MQTVKAAFLRWLVNPTEVTRMALDTALDAYNCACNHQAKGKYDGNCVYCTDHELHEVPALLRSQR